MSSVDVSAEAPHLRPGDAFDALADFERYAEICAQVRSVTLERLADDRLRSSWEADFRDGVLMWTEEDQLDRTAGTITFSQVDGDFEEFAGSWSVRPRDEGAEVSFHAEFDLGITSLRSSSSRSPSAACARTSS